MHCSKAAIGNIGEQTEVEVLRPIKRASITHIVPKTVPCTPNLHKRQGIFVTEVGDIREGHQKSIEMERFKTGVWHKEQTEECGGTVKNQFGLAVPSE